MVGQMGADVGRTQPGGANVLPTALLAGFRWGGGRSATPAHQSLRTSPWQMRRSRKMRTKPQVCQAREGLHEVKLQVWPQMLHSCSASSIPNHEFLSKRTAMEPRC